MSEFSFGENSRSALYSVVFPEDICCNCATNKHLKIVETDIRNTRYWGNGGTESVFIFYLPFCPVCEASATRPAKTLFHRSLQLLLVFAVGASTLMLVGINFDLPQVMAYLLPISAGLAVVTMATVLFWQRPRPGQSSYFQPVRILKAKRKMFTVKVVGLTLQFTNPDYRKRFCEMNRKSITEKVIQVKSHDGC